MIVPRVQPKKGQSEQPSEFSRLAESMKDLLRRSKKAACVNISVSSAERGPRRVEVERASGHEGEAARAALS
jgi:hypothetical protein